MRLLLDTHIWLWMLVDPDRLGGLRAVVEDESAELLLSAASSWEITIKHSIGRLPLPEPPHSYIPARIRTTRVVPIAVEHTHAVAVGRLPDHHRDPFDRLLVAQAQLLDVPIATADRLVQAYDVRTVTPLG